MRSITDLPAPAARARFRADFGQRFIVTVDTEEEFDWTGPFTRTQHGLEHLSSLTTFQQFCEDAGVAPIYLVDYPVASSRLATEILREPAMQGRAEIGVQLHPWVNPPFDEEVNTFNSFAGNLPAELERAKFNVLRDQIVDAFGVQPQIYRAGRYGLGPNTESILREGGITIDSSVRSCFDYSKGGGGNYHFHPLEPYWVGHDHTLLELPLTTVFSGMLRRRGNIWYSHLWRIPQIRGLLAKMGVLERIPLTPEGVTKEEALKGIDVAVENGLPLLVFSFHSPSLQPGHTPYVRTQDDLDGLYAWWRAVFSRLEHMGVRPTTVREIQEAAEA